MTAREKILLGLTATAAVGAGIYYAFGFANPDADAPSKTRVDFSALITNVQVDLRRGELTDREERILAASTTRWLRSPLLERPLVTQVSKPDSAPLPKFVGYISIGADPIAIVDGRDYRTGDAIEGGEYHLTQIHPDHIKLLRRGATDPVDVPLEKAQPAGESE